MPHAAKTKVAIACQGGGSQAAFMAGALARILRDPLLDNDYQLVSLSGTSGGAVCCLLAWYGLLERDGDRAHAADLIDAFWIENSARDPWERFVVNPLAVATHRLIDHGLLPAMPAPPFMPHFVRGLLKYSLEKFVDFRRLPDLLSDKPDHPTLYCGSVDVLSGEFVVFEEACTRPTWRRLHQCPPPAVGVDAVLASAAVPPLMPATRLGDGAYWDGLFAHNPPIRRLLEVELAERPDEIWVIQIDPDTDARVPQEPLAIVDRRFELTSNLSLNAELHWVRQINEWVAAKILPDDLFKIIQMPRITMSNEIATGLDLASKSNRDPDFLRRLAADGREQAEDFLLDLRGRTDTDWCPQTFPDGHDPHLTPAEYRLRAGRP